MRVAVLDDYFNKALELADWSPLEGRADIKVFTEYLGSDEDTLAKTLGDFEIIVGMRERTAFRAGLLKRLPKLKLLITTGARNASFDIAAANAQGVTVCGTGGVGSPTSELAVGMMIALMRDIPGQNKSMREGGWQTRPGIDLAGKTMGMLGLGKLGGAVARAANAFDMKVIAWSQNLTDERAKECNATRVEKDALFKQSDVISIHLVLSDRSRGLVGEHELSLMKPTAYIVNTSRGPIIDEKALLKTMRDKRIAGAAIDVYGTEPLPRDDPFRNLDNVLLLPHLGYVTSETFARMYTDAVADIRAFLDGSPVRVIKPK
jgi:phosphoglycerate dehydrogenase-like enzyme